MKRQIFYLLAVLLLSGCASNSISAGVPQIADTASVAKSNLSTDVSAIGFYGQADGTLGKGCGTDAGYYYCQERGENHAELRYLDYASKTAMPLCSRPECTHADDTCTAWLGWRGGYPQLTANDTNLILAYAGATQTDAKQAQDAALAHLEILDLNGARKRLLVNFKADEDLQPGIACDATAAYVLKSNVVDGALHTVLCAVSLADGTVREVYTLPHGASFIVGAAGRNVIVKSFSAPVGDALYTAGDTQTFFCIDADTGACVGQKALLFDHSAAMPQALAEGTMLYVFSPAENTVTATDLITGEEKYKVENLISQMVQFGQIMRIFDDKLILSEIFTENANQASTQFWVNLATGEQGTLTLTGSAGEPSAHSNFAIVPACSVNDSFLTVYQCAEDKVKLYDEAARLMEATVTVPHYAFIAKADYFANTANFTPFTEVQNG